MNLALFTPVLFLLGHVFFLVVFPATTPAPSNLITPSVYVAYQSPCHCLQQLVCWCWCTAQTSFLLIFLTGCLPLNGAFALWPLNNVTLTFKCLLLIHAGDSCTCLDARHPVWLFLTKPDLQAWVVTVYHVDTVFRKTTTVLLEVFQLTVCPCIVVTCLLCLCMNQYFLECSPVNSSV